MFDPLMHDLPAPDVYALSGASINLGGGFTVSDVDRPEPRPMCGKCMNPYTREGNPECVNR